MGSTNFNHGLGVCDLKAVKFEQDLVGRSLKQNEDSKFDSNHRQEFNSHLRRHRTEEQKSTSVAVGEQFQIDDSNICSTSSICPAPLSRQFWRAGNYDDMIKSKPPIQNGTSYLRIHPKFLHSNATSHKWAFGAMAELLDNSVDEIQNGATFVIVDKTSNPRDGTPALLFQDNGGGMDPAAMRRCMSFGFSDKKSKGTIGQYGNGFKTSSMRLGADVIVFSRHTRDRKFTQSVGLLSYTFLMQTKQDRIVVPMVDYLFDTRTGSWNTLQHEQQFNTNLSILLRWSPFATEAELLKQCDDIGPNGTRIIIYSLWHTDEGKLELDFDVDPEDICISGKIKTKNISQFEANERHLAKRLQHSLRAYLSVLYLRVPDNFSILLRGRAVEYHSIANDLKFPEFILYKPLNVEGSVITTIGFLKEAPAVNVHGFNVYHKNRLILPFWHVVTYSDSRGRGVVGVLEANFIEPTHNKQDFEKTSVFQKLETRLREMTQEYWDYHCGLIGYQAKKKPRPMTSLSSPDSRQCHGTHQPVILGRYSQCAVGANISTGTRTSQREISTPSTPISEPITSKQSFDQNSQGAPLKRKGNDLVVEPERVKRMGVIGSGTTDTAFGGNYVTTPAVQFEDQEAVHIIQENKKLHAQCQEYEKGHEELNLKVTRLKAEIREARREYARLLLESKQLEKVKRENRAVT